MRSDNYTRLRCMLAARLRKPTPPFIMGFRVGYSTGTTSDVNIRALMLSYELFVYQEVESSN